MHEMSLAEGIRQIVEDAGRAQGFGRVRTVVLEIGQLASVEPEALRFCFDVVMKDSIAAGATLTIETLPGSGWCMQCARSVPVTALYEACPCCGSYQVQPTGGTEMRVKELEID